MTTKTKKSKLRALLKRMPLSVVMLVFAVLGVISIAVAFVNPSKVPFVGFLSLLYVPIFIINVCLLVIGAVLRKKSTFMTLCALVLCAFFVPRYVQIRSKKELPQKTPTTVSVLSWNVGQFCAYMSKIPQQEFNKKTEENKKLAVDAIKSLDADIVCLQECPASVAEELCRKLGGKYKIVETSLGNGLVIMGKLKKVGTGGRFVFKHSTNGACYADFNIAGKVLRVYNCHLESYGQSPYKILKSVFALEKHELEVKGQAMQRSQESRSVQIDSLCSHIAGCNKKHIVCGDFNDTPLSYTYSRIRRNHKDVFKTAGRGFGGTFRFMWPLIRIDYFFYSKSLKPLYYNCVDDVEISDHYPIIAYFQY